MHLYLETELDIKYETQTSTWNRKYTSTQSLMNLLTCRGCMTWRGCFCFFKCSWILCTFKSVQWRRLHVNVHVNNAIIHYYTYTTAISVENHRISQDHITETIWETSSCPVSQLPSLSFCLLLSIKRSKKKFLKTRVNHHGEKDTGTCPWEGGLLGQITRCSTETQCYYN